MPNFAVPVACDQDNTPGRLGFPTPLNLSLCPFTPARSAMLCTPLYRRGRFYNRGWVGGVGAAAADIARKGLLALLLGRIWILVKKGLGRDQKSRRTVAALHGVPLAVGVNQRPPPGISRNPFNSLDRLAFQFPGHRQ